MKVEVVLVQVYCLYQLVLCDLFQMVLKIRHEFQRSTKDVTLTCAYNHVQHT